MQRTAIALLAILIVPAGSAGAADALRPGPVPLAAEPAGPDDAFGFLDGSGVGNAGDRAIVSETTARFGKLDGSYAGVNSKLEAAWTPVNRLQVAVALWGSYHAIRNNTVPGYPNVNRAAFDGLAGQVRYMLRERGAGPFDPGVTVGLELRWGRFSEGLAVPAERFSATLKVAMDAALVGDRLYGAVNLNLGPGTEHPRGQPGFVNESAVELGGALAWRVAEGGSTFVGGNVRYVAAYGGPLFNQWAGHAVLVGPTFYHRFGDIGPLKETFVSLAWNVQVWGRAAGGATGSLDLVNAERHQLRVKIGGAF